MRKFGIVFMALGLVLGVFAWQYDGTGTASESQNEARAAITQNLEDQNAEDRFVYPWTNAQPKDSIHSPVYPWTNAQPIKPKKIKIGSSYFDSVGLLSIPAIGVKNEPVVDDFTQAALDASLIGSMGTPPGAIGNFVVIGHRITHNEIFRDLGKLRKNDLVKIQTAAGTFTYRIRGSGVTIVDTDTWVLRAVPSKTKNLVAKNAVISLLTCAELFHSNRRIAIFGDLVMGTP